MTESMRSVNRSELAKELGVNLTTVDSYRRRGIPEHDEDGKTRFNLLECVLWKTAFTLCNEDPRLAELVRGDLLNIAKKIERTQCYLLFRLWLRMDGANAERLGKASIKLSAAICDLIDIGHGRMTEDEEREVALKAPSRRGEARP